VPAKGLVGARKLVGHTGTVGGAVVQNIGAYGAALSETLLWVEVLNDQGAVETLFIKTAPLGTATVIFKHNLSYVVVRAAFALSTNPKPKTSYKDLAKLFNDPPRLGETGSSADLGAIRSAVLSIRAAKFPDLAVEARLALSLKTLFVSKERSAYAQGKYLNFRCLTCQKLPA